MEVISILLGSRRPYRLRQMWESFYNKASQKAWLQAAVYIDDDDEATISEARKLAREYPNFISMWFPRNPIMSQMTNDCYDWCTGEIVMMGADDVECQTEGWDTVVRDTFKLYPDRAVLVYGTDGHWGSTFATHPFLSREAINVLGEVCDGRFHHAYADRALWDIYTSINRTHYIPIITYHKHPDYHERLSDSVDANQKENFKKYRPDLLYLNSGAIIKSKSDKLSSYIRDFQCQTLTTRV